ncbi:MarR family transcriptional regulator (plasmid) [Salipiger sp. H15]|uniref:MarR family transcriptional regulator n=1 Tax=Alloyangia sp. H15 TaxID=3029062 RepID=A0AAU8ARL5_9RHOB
MPRRPTDLQPEAARLTETLSDLWAAITTASRSRGQPSHLAPTQARALQMIAENDGITPAALAAQLEMSRPQLSEVLRRLEDGELVLRMKSSTDGRSFILTPTTAGLAALGHLRHGPAGAVAEALSSLREEDARKIIASLPALSRLAAALSGIVDGDVAS